MVSVIEKVTPQLLKIMEKLTPIFAKLGYSLGVAIGKGIVKGLFSTDIAKFGESKIGKAVGFGAEKLGIFDKIFSYGMEKMGFPRGSAAGDSVSKQLNMEMNLAVPGNATNQTIQALKEPGEEFMSKVAKSVQNAFIIKE